MFKLDKYSNISINMIHKIGNFKTCKLVNYQSSIIIIIIMLDARYTCITDIKNRGEF